MLPARARPRLSGGEKKGLGAGKNPKMLLDGSFHPMLEADQEGESGCGVPDARSPETPRFTSHLQSWSHPDGAQRGVLVAPWRMGWGSRGIWGWRRWGQRCHKPWGQESWGCSGSWEPSWALPGTIAALSPSLPAADLGSASSLRTILLGGVPGGCPRRGESDRRWHLPLEAPCRPAAKAPPPNPKPQPWRREEGAHPVWGDAAGPAPMGATRHGCRLWWGTSQAGRGTYEDVEAVPVEVAVAAQAVPPAVAPRPGEEAEQQQVPEHSPHGGTGSGCGTAETKPVKLGRHRHHRAPQLH